MSNFLADRTAVVDWIRRLGSKSEVYFPQPAGDASFEFAPVAKGSNIQFEQYRNAMPRKEFRASTNVVPPGKMLAPAREELFRFQRNENGEYDVTPVFDETQRVLAGVRPCDLKAIHLMDQVNSEGVGDPNYLTRRVNTTIIAHDCLRPCDERCFCDATGSLRTRVGADIFLTPIIDELLVECLTEKGEGLVANAGFAPCTDPDAKKAQAEAQRANPFGRQFNLSVDQLPDMLEQQWDSPVWDKHVERCFSCGTCNLVCPTCYCFDVHDDIELADPSAGTRFRTWDGCMLPGFAEVAGGHNFRADAAGRQRHRVKRKFEYLPKHVNEGSFCVGCGRCGQQCTVDIDIFDIVNDLAAAPMEKSR